MWLPNTGRNRPLFLFPTKQNQLTRRTIDQWPWHPYYVNVWRAVCRQLLGELEDKLDPLQVAYKETLMMNSPAFRYSHWLDSTHPHARILLMDFSSAFNTGNNILLQPLSDLQVHPTLTLWIKDFLMARPQHVFLIGFKSSSMVLKIGLPQAVFSHPSCSASPTPKPWDGTNRKATPWSKHLLRDH